MNKNNLQDQILILGIIDNLFDSLKIDSNRKETRDNLLAGIQATFTNKLLENTEVAEVFKSALKELPQDATFETTMKAIQDAMQGKTLDIDSSILLKESAKEILSEFVIKSQKPELVEQINLILQ